MPHKDHQVYIATSPSTSNSLGHGLCKRINMEYIPSEADISKFVKADLDDLIRQLTFDEKASLLSVRSRYDDVYDG